MFTLEKVTNKAKLFPTSLLFSNSNEDVPMVSEVYNHQLYNPLYGLFFEPSTCSVDDVAMNHKYYVHDETHVIDRQTDEVVGRDIFIKHSPLLDPIHFLVGKYQKNKQQINSIPMITNHPDCLEKVCAINNASYVDNFFNYLSSQMLNNHNVINGIDYYGSNLMIQKRFRFNVYDDIDYLQESESFLRNNSKTYVMEKLQSMEDSHSRNTQRKRHKLKIEDDEALVADDILLIDNDVDAYKRYDLDEPIETVFEQLKEKEPDSDDNSDISNSSDEASTSSGSDYNDTDDEIPEEENDSDDESEDDDDDNDDDDDDDSQELYAYLFDFPVQTIALEKCDGTFDSLLEEKKMKENEVAAALLQVIFTLLIYQTSFAFTHNDLHTNNIVFKETTEKFIWYKYESKLYKVPTFGRIFKIIDFGRSIYRFGDKVLCSDSFSPGGDAHGQYNTEPYYNPNKPRLEPNYSFDLCRLGCSMYDFVFEDDENEFDPKLDDMTPLQQTVYRWCQDDYGKNILYKRTGEERYPSFKLYKMMSRIVHKHRPQLQLNETFFSQFESTKNLTGASAKKCININLLPKYYNV
jgi:hypothetical protein